MVFSVMSAKDFKKKREAKRYTQAELASALDVDVMTVSRWERGAVPVPRMAELALSALKSRPKTKRKGD